MAAPLLRTFRRVTVVMHSSSGDALRPVWGCLSDCRASAVQRLRTFSRAQHVVSTIICWCSQSSDVDSDFGVKQGEFFAERLLQAAHEPYRIPAPSRAAVVLPSPSEFSSSYGKPWYLCWRDVIVAGRCGKSSTSFVAGGLPTR
jgi:hypothetical protein